MPGRSNKYDELRKQADDYEMPYISKSRLKLWMNNPEHFRLKYLEGYRGRASQAMVRGSKIHESIEGFYNNATEQYEDVGLPPGDFVSYLPEDTSLWQDYIEPYMTNFFAWEHRRLEYAPSVESWLPVAVEEEHWLEDRDPPWTGLADVIVNADSLPEFEGEDGVVIIDFKTGKVPDEKYRDDGIHIELAYYEALFGEKYDVAGSGAYYPKSDTFITKTSDDEWDRNRINEAVDELIETVENYDGEDHFETNPGPLCKWGEDEDEESAFYGICPCTWGVPANNREQFEQMVDDGVPAQRIADELDTTEDAVWYWKYKFDL